MFSRWQNLKSKKSLILQGPRRAGKSTLLTTLFKDYKYVTLDDLDDLNNARLDPKGFIESLGKKFIIDEAQRVPELTIPVKKLIDEKKIHCILTGSTGINLSDKIYDTLAGRVDYIKLPTCVFGENYGEPTHSLFEKINSNEEKIAKRKFESFLKYGGFPEILAEENQDEKELLLKNYKNSYFTRDLAQLINVESVEGIKAMFGALVKGLGSRYEMNSLSKESGLSVPTTKKYLNSIISTGLIFKLYGYHLGPAKRYLSRAKTYFLDQGILHSLSDEFSKGQQVENFVISEIEKRRQLGQIKSDELFYYESSDGSEIDLIVDEREIISIIEIKSSKKLTGRDLHNLKYFKLQTTKKVRKILFYLGNEFYQEGDIQIIPIWNFFRAKWERP
jgi:predicted AAA+ superfamily ATPase